MSTATNSELTAHLSFDEVMRLGMNDLHCTRCKAVPGEPCRSRSGEEVGEPHKARVDAYWAAAADAKLREDAGC
ncbi:hypothetical protein [Phycicoccus sp.]|uniref:zinc finger domain-containing protein n=1 Tax=Phycicoccus sp. TaxID=1902410 RepID=UPI002C6FC61F|nr:hypothetical protein [Phycicoccus sp.]HMM95325.1 hypothetical protein [Phycicoccus sp.]